MSARPKDFRPKVISFHTEPHGLNIAARQDILWPCHAFNISIPQKKKSPFNIFEETVLKITEVESCDTEEIAQITCMEKELVSFIQNRLNQLGLLNDRYELSEQGKKLLENWKGNREENIEYAVANVFMDLLTEKLLPFIYTGNIKYEKIISIDNIFINIESGSTGKSREQKCRLITPSKDSCWKTVPTSTKIIRAINSAVPCLFLIIFLILNS